MVACGGKSGFCGQVVVRSSDRLLFRSVSRVQCVRSAQDGSSKTRTDRTLSSIGVPSAADASSSEANTSPRAEENSSERLPRETVIHACIRTSGFMGLVGGLVISLAPQLQTLAGASSHIDAWQGLDRAPSTELLIGACAGILVTSCRTCLTYVWDDLRTSTSRANSQVLLTDPPMSPADVACVACLPALSEEILFRGGLVGLLGGSAAAVVFSGLIFGALHISGGRNAASGAFAAMVGILYGWVFVYTGSLYAAIVAHCVGNLTSASMWLATRKSSS